MDLTSWQTQVRKGTAELVILALVRTRERYGGEILDKARGLADVLSDGALYPLLNRLEREGKLAARWSVAETGGHPRKYYRLTAEGVACFQAMYEVWSQFSAGVNRVIEEAEDDDAAPAARRTIPAQPR
jgi:PadR family transcriptional regulator PadR